MKKYLTFIEKHLPAILASMLIILAIATHIPFLAAMGGVLIVGSLLLYGEL